jgi:4-amino-4-deoxy-L-arabinose transferase-like glycosyltransferase
VFLPAAAELAWRNWREPAVRFCVAAILPGWLLLELVPTKLPHYILPLTPLVVLLGAACGDPRLPRAASRRSLRGGVILFALSGLLIGGVVAFAVLRLGSGGAPIVALGLAVLFVLIVMAAVVAWRGDFQRSLAATVACGAVASLLIFAGTLPRLQRLWVAERAARVAHSIAGPEAETVVVGYHEPSMVFLLGTRTRFLDAQNAVAALEAGDVMVAIVAAPRFSDFTRAAHSRALSLERVAAVDGIDPVHGRPITLTVWRAADPDRGQGGCKRFRSARWPCLAWSVVRR